MKIVNREDRLMEITATTKLFDVLKEYPSLEEKIIGIAPPFKNLKNPVLKRTVGKLATIEKVALIGEQDVNGFVNTLRREVGQPELGAQKETLPTWQKGEPEWIKNQPVETVNGTEMLSSGVHPLAHVNQVMQSLQTGQCILLKTNFKPIPLIEAMEKQNYEVYTKTAEDQPDLYYTFIRK